MCIINANLLIVENYWQFLLISIKLFPASKNFRETDKAKLSFKSCQNQHKTLEQFLPTATIDECAFVGGDNGIFSAVHWIQFEIDSPAAADERRN